MVYQVTFANPFFGSSTDPKFPSPGRCSEALLPMAVADMGDTLGTVSSAHFWEARQHVGWQIGFGWKKWMNTYGTIGRWKDGRKF